MVKSVINSIEFQSIHHIGTNAVYNELFVKILAYDFGITCSEHKNILTLEHLKKDFHVIFADCLILIHKVADMILI